MSFEDIVLNYQGFHPSELTESQLNRMVRAIYEKSPYGSTLRASFMWKEKAYKGVIKITSGAGSFFAVASGLNLNEVTRHLFFQIKRRLDRWKTRRFQGRDRFEKVLL